MRFVIVGNSVAAVRAVDGIRSQTREGTITIIGEEAYPAYGRPLISYWLEGKTGESLDYRPQRFYEENNVQLVLGRRAERLDTAQQQVVLSDGTVVPYDRLLIATGSSPFVPPIEGLEPGMYFNFYSRRDVETISRAVQPGARAVVIGSGLSGLKAVESLVHRGAKVTVVELAERILSTVVEPAAAEVVAERLRQEGVTVRTGVTAAKVERKAASSAAQDDCVPVVLTLTDGQTLEADLLVMAIGVRPNVGWLKGSGVEINRGVVVDERLETNIPGVFAAGDVVECRHRSSKATRVYPLLPNATIQGYEAGRAMAGAQVRYPGAVSFNSFSLFGLPVAVLDGGYDWLNIKESNLKVVEYRGSQDVLPTVFTPDTGRPKPPSLRIFTFCGERLVRAVLVGDIRRAGILRFLIESEVPLPQSLREYLISGGVPSLLSLPEKLQQSLLEEAEKGAVVV